MRGSSVFCRISDQVEGGGGSRLWFFPGSLSLRSCLLSSWIPAVLWFDAGPRAPSFLSLLRAEQGQDTEHLELGAQGGQVTLMGRCVPFGEGEMPNFPRIQSCLVKLRNDLLHFLQAWVEALVQHIRKGGGGVSPLPQWGAGHSLNPTTSPLACGCYLSGSGAVCSPLSGHQGLFLSSQRSLLSFSS